MMEMTETLFRNIFQEINGQQTTTIWINDEEHEIDFSKDFQRINIIPKLESIVGQLPPLENGNCILMRLHSTAIGHMQKPPY